MKHCFNRLTAGLISAVMASFSLGSFAVYAEEETTIPTEVTIHFDLSDKDASFTTDENGDPIVIEDLTVKPNSFVNLPAGELEKDGFKFSGWTLDGVRGYTPSEVYNIGAEDVTLKPVWSDLNDENYHHAYYKADLNGEEIDTTKDINQKTLYRKGDFVTVSMIRYQDPAYKSSQLGWNYNGVEYKSQQHVIMGDEDITFTSAWHLMRTILYTAGDVDRVKGANEIAYERIASTVGDLAGADKFVRFGFKQTGWTCDYDGKSYLPYGSFTMPDCDVVMTAIWQPKSYTVTFDPGTKSSDKMRFTGLTDSNIPCPDINVIKSGYYFDGWSYLGKTYQPGDDFRIYTLDGSSITATAIWKEGEKPSDPTDLIYGDADCSGVVKMNDAVLIMQSLSNGDIYGVGGSAETALTEKGAANADCYEPGSKLTPNDALAVQKMLLGAISLPYTPDSASDF